MPPHRLDRVAALRATDLFGTLSEPVLRAVAAFTMIRNLSRSEILYSQEEEASAIYVVATGELRSIRQSVAGKEQVLSTERAGAILAAAAIFHGEKLYSTMIADTPSTVLAIARRDARDLCHNNPELLWNLAGVLAHKLRHSAELIENLALRNVDQRVAHHLLAVCHQRGLQDNDSCVVELTMNRTEIASRLGSAREVVSRAFTQLEKAGLIQMQGRRLVTIPDIQALRAFAGADTAPKKTKQVTELCSGIL